MKGERMKKTLILFALLLCAAAVLGSYSRQMALGSGSKFFRDAVDVIHAPGLAPQHGNLVDAELGSYTTAGGTPTGQWAMVNLNMNDAVYIGAALRRIEGYAFQLADDFSITAPNPGFDVWGAYDMGGFSIGLGLYAAGYSEKMTWDGSDQENNYKAGVTTIKAGIGAKVGDADIEGTVNFSMNGLKEENINSANETQTWETTGGSHISLGLRGFIPWGYDAELVPVVAFSTFSHSLEMKSYSGTVTNFGDYSEMFLTAGAALNYKVMEDGVVSVGLSLNMATEKDEIDTTAKTERKTITLPEVTISAEIPTFKWMVLRAGVSKEFNKNTFTTPVTESTWSDSELNNTFINFGAGLTFGNFELDMTISESFLFYGPNFVSGINNNIAAMASLSYYWNR